MCNSSFSKFQMDRSLNSLWPFPDRLLLLMLKAKADPIPPLAGAILGDANWGLQGQAHSGYAADIRSLFLELPDGLTALISSRTNIKARCDPVWDASSLPLLQVCSVLAGPCPTFSAPGGCVLLFRARLPLVCKWKRLILDPNGLVWADFQIVDDMPFQSRSCEVRLCQQKFSTTCAMLSPFWFVLWMCCLATFVILHKISKHLGSSERLLHDWTGKWPCDWVEMLCKLHHQRSSQFNTLHPSGLLS